MRTRVLLLSAAVGAGSMLSAFAGAKQDVLAAAKKLSEAGGYTWKSSAEGSRFGGSALGKIDKNGVGMVSRTFGDNESVSVFKGKKAAVETDDGWQSLKDLEGSEGRGRFRAMMLRAFEAPADQVKSLVERMESVTAEEGVCSGKLTGKGAEEMMRFGRRGEGGPTVRDASGDAKFWIKDGALTKYQYRLKGSITFGDNERDFDRTTTVEISKVGQTTVNLPSAAEKKLAD